MNDIRLLFVSLLFFYNKSRLKLSYQYSNNVYDCDHNNLQELDKALNYTISANIMGENIYQSLPN